MEIKYGFVPNAQETTAWRLRRRYRLVKGGHPQITLVHYTRGPVIRESRPMLLVSDKYSTHIRIPYRWEHVYMCHGVWVI